MKGVARASNPDILKVFVRIVELTNRWARSVLSDLNWSKLRGTTGKIEPSPQFLAKEKFTFQREISTGISNHDILNTFVLRIPRTVHFQL